VRPFDHTRFRVVVILSEAKNLNRSRLADRIVARQGPAVEILRSPGRPQNDAAGLRGTQQIPNTGPSPSQENFMAIAINVQNVDASGVVVWVTGTLSFSSNYVTGGDTLDWTTAIPQVGQSGAATPSAAGPQQVMFDSQNGNPGYYVPVQGNAPNNWKLKCFQGGGTELSAGAYPASITSDIVVFQAQFKRLQ
jgi:hypothetical protein